MIGVGAGAVEERVRAFGDGGELGVGGGLAGGEGGVEFADRGEQCRDGRRVGGASGGAVAVGALLAGS